MVLCGFNFLIKYICFKWILYVGEDKIKKMPYTGSRRWRDLLWCSVICRNSFLAVNQLFWSVELIRQSRLWTLARWFVQLFSNGICHQGVTEVSLGSCDKRGVCRGAAPGVPSAGWGCGRASWVLLEQRVLPGGNANVVSSYLLYRRSRSKWHWNISFHFFPLGLDVGWQNSPNPFPSITFPLLDPHSLGEKSRKKYYTEKVLIALPWTVTLNPKWCSMWGIVYAKGRAWHLRTKVRCIHFFRKVINDFQYLNGTLLS